MRLLTDPELLSDTIGAIYDCAMRPERWELVLAELAGMIGARRAFLGIGSPGGTMKAIVVDHGIDFSPQDAARYNPINPILPLGMVWPFDRALVASRDYGLEELRATRFYREYLAPRGDLDMIGFALMREGDATGHWLLITQMDRPPITAEEAAGLELVAPHVRRAVEISRVLGDQSLSARTYRAALERLDAAVLILDGKRRVTYANPQAEAALAAGRVLRTGPDGRLRGATDAAERALLRAGEGTAGGIEAPVSEENGEEHLLFALSLDLAAEDRLGQEERATLLVLRSPREDTRNPVTIAARVFGLTPAQVQVLAFLAQGHAPEDIAGILGVSVATVRSHLADLFRRTGTARQAELIARTLSLASPLRTDLPPA
ncbi:helix-turn-helix transcriptional regulator [Roseicella aerolata]|uniref:LuxR C-terminal-related transcriptional regulator n=1 Tax=Roseicella aerolata TaxID=2883479 RepID=A0A9X1IEB3_9PROT|nr:helix-turn-helix transcriptional regulator [Roseicella aerolata]MCB4822153.1 LuxR C-terminal-related transcriptional regulator [Roseicella aerolata]